VWKKKIVKLHAILQHNFNSKIHFPDHLKQKFLQKSKCIYFYFEKQRFSTVQGCCFCFEA